MQMSFTKVLGAPIDVILLAERSRHVDPDLTKRLLENTVKALISSNTLRVGVIVFSSNAMPLIDLTVNKEKVLSALEEIPILSGPPNVIKALSEAIEMFNDFKDPITLARFIVLICGCGGRPPKAFKILLRQLFNLDIQLIIIVLGPRSPTWLSSIVDKSSILTIRWNTTPERVTLKVLESMSGFLEKRRRFI